MTDTISEPPPPEGVPAAPGGPLRRLLDHIYWLGGLLSAICLVALLVVIIAQMVARWTSVMFPGGADYAGYLMAAASFLAFAHALNQGAHIRVGMVLNLLGPRRPYGEFLCIGIGTLITGLLAWYSIRLVQMSWRFNDISQGQDAMPLWIVQLPMAVGAVMLALCFFDNFITLLVTGTSPIAARELEGGESHAE